VCDDAVVSVSTFLATCAVLHGGEVWCWGRDVWGEIGIASSDPGNTTCYMGDRCRTTPTKITAGLPAPATDPAVEIAAGREATCARTRSGAVYCWGSNEAGMLGYATTTMCMKGTTSTMPGPCSPTPQAVGLPAGTVATQLSLGTVTACALTSTNDVYCWGSNWSAEEQTPASQTIVTTPTHMASGVAQVSVGTDQVGNHDAVCIRLLGSGDVQCWGASAGGTLFPCGMNAACNAGGDPYCTPTPTPVPTVFSPNSNVSITGDALAVGAFDGVVLQGTNALTWGSDPFGQGGFGQAASPGTNHFDLRMLPGLPAIAAISNGGLTTLLLDTTGSVWALGWSDGGEIGNGTFTNGLCPLNGTQQCRDTPVKIPTLSSVKQIMAGMFSAAAITQNGKLWMWGANYEGSLGHAPSVPTDGACQGSTLACSPTPIVVTIVP
jgi:alpha-tubulin suppressor-like RCC1 family protein